MGILAHLAGRVLRTLFGVFFAGIFFGALGAGIALAVAYAASGVWPPQTLAIVAAVAFGVVLAYAAALTVLLRAIVGVGKAVEHDIVQAAQHELSEVKK